MYRVIFLPTAEESFKKLDPPTQRRISQKIDWLSANADKIIHHIIHWVYDELKHIKIYDIEHRGKDYRSIKR